MWGTVNSRPPQLAASFLSYEMSAYALNRRTGRPVIACVGG